MIYLLPFEYCPICSRAGEDNSWIKINHNVLWWERMCSNYHTRCGFAQFYWDSFEDNKLRYLQFKTKDFHAYTYATVYAVQAKNLGVFSGTRFYYNVYPRDGSPQSPFQSWYDYTPDWDNLDKLNKKLNLLSTFS